MDDDVDDEVDDDVDDEVDVVDSIDCLIVCSMVSGGCKRVIINAFHAKGDVGLRNTLRQLDALAALKDS